MLSGTLLLPVFVILAGHPPQPAPPKYPTAFNPAIVQDPRIEAAFASIEARKEQLIQEWMDVTAIPAPSGKEQDRARYLCGELQKIGLKDIRIDAAGNVSAVRKGDQPPSSSPPPVVVFSAHMDTVVPPTANIAVRRDGKYLRGPGIGDDSGNLVALLELFRVLDRSQIRTKADLIFLATAQEETTLNGARYWLTHAPTKPDAFISVDIPLGLVWYGALRLAEFQFVFTAPGAHTLMSRDEPSPVRAAARAINAIYQIPLPPPAIEALPMRLPVINIGKMGGGTVYNAIPKEAYFTVDLRSLDSTTQDKLQTEIMKAAKAAAAAEHVTLQVEKVPSDDIDYSNALPRATRRAHPLVQTAVDIHKFMKLSLLPDAVDIGSTDANVGVSLGIPSIAVGATAGKDAHTAEESAEAASIVPGIKSLLLLAVSLAKTAP